MTLPADFFKQGPNEIQLTCADGSWVQYDAITLLNDAGGQDAGGGDSRRAQPGVALFHPPRGQLLRAGRGPVALSASRRRFDAAGGSGRADE